MGELTLDDLASGSTEEAAEAAEQARDAAESGESLLDMVEFLDERGYLGPLVFGQEGMDPEAMQSVEDTGGGPALTAENIAEFGDTITDQIGDVPLSTVVEYCRENPAEVDKLIEANV